MIRKATHSLFSSPKTIWAVALVSLFATSCAPPKGTFANNPDGGTGSTSYSGYVIVANNANRSVVMYDPNFTESTARVLKLYPTGNTPMSLAVYDSDSVLVAVDGTPDRVDRITLSTGVTTTGFILDSTNLTGTMKRIARLSGGDVIVSDATTGAHMERFAVSASSFLRYTTGWPATLLNTTFALFPLSNNTFLACAGGTSDVARTFTNVGGTIVSATALLPVPTLGAAHDAVGCVANASGQIAVAWNGATDTVRLYNSTLSTTVWSYSDLALLSAPLTLGVRPNGNLLAIDTSNLVVEINGSTGAFVTSFAPGLVATANQILVMP